jgi:hypothetical protein
VEVNAVLSGRDRLLAPLKIDGDSDAVWFLDELGCSDRVAFRVLKLCRPPPVSWAPAISVRATGSDTTVGTATNKSMRFTRYLLFFLEGAGTATLRPLLALSYKQTL